MPRIFVVKRARPAVQEHKTRVHIQPLVLLAVGFSWLALDFYLIVGPTILRETA